MSVKGVQPTKNKLLVCAQSNAAIDEVCKRLMEGVPKPSAGVYAPRIVRLGDQDSIVDDVKGISFIGRAEKQVAWSKGPEWRSRGRERGTRYDNDRQTRELRSGVPVADHAGGPPVLILR
jgi:senataxin